MSKPTGHAMASDRQKIILSIPVEIHAQLRARAVASDLAMADVVRLALRYYLENTAEVPTP